MNIVNHPFIDDSVGAYLAAAGEIPPLSPEEEILRVQHIRAKDQHTESSRQPLVEANLRLVVSIIPRQNWTRAASA